MNSNSRFAVAIHVLTVLANRSNERITSEYIASSVCTNPVVIRRALGELRRAGLVDSLSGNRGGWRLLKSAQQITLFEVYCAVREGLPFGLAANEPNPRCVIGAQITEQVTEIFQEAELQMEEYFQSVSIHDILSRMKLNPCNKSGTTIQARSMII